MLNIGPPELLLILVIALVVVGPHRLPDLGRTIGKGLREFRKVQDEVRDMVDVGLDDDLRQTASELKQSASDLRKASDVSSLFRNTPHQARQRAAAAVTGASTPDEVAPATDDTHPNGDIPADRAAEPTPGAQASDHDRASDPDPGQSHEPAPEPDDSPPQG
jgi:Tat protein translocase TatB subunit